MSQEDDGTDPVGDFVEGIVDGMVTGYCLFVTFIDQEGKTSYWGDTMQGQVATTSIGIAETMVAIEKHRVISRHFGLPEADNDEA